MARGLAALDDVALTVVVNVGDDAENHGLAICPDLDTVVYTLAGEEGPQGWGRFGDTFFFNTELARFGVDNTFLLGDKDLALKVYRTASMRTAPLSEVTAKVVSSFGLGVTVLPVTDDPVRTQLRVEEGWIGFQEYFVHRGHRDEVLELRFAGAADATPAPGVIEALDTADLVVVAPSNPPLSVWPILAVPGVGEAVRRHSKVVAVSPLIGGAALKGPADRVMASLGLPRGNQGVLQAYSGLIDTLVIDESDAGEPLAAGDVDIFTTDTLIGEPEAARRLAAELVER